MDCEQPAGAKIDAKRAFLRVTIDTHNPYEQGYAVCRLLRPPVEGDWRFEMETVPHNKDDVWPTSDYLLEEGLYWVRNRGVNEYWDVRDGHREIIKHREAIRRLERNLMVQVT